MQQMSLRLLRCMLLLLSIAAGHAFAQDFGDYFQEKTLRIDYVLTGDANEQEISLDCLSCLPQWYGKRFRLAETPVEGNGQISVYDHRSHVLIYKHSFSTLFQEWLSYPEAKTCRKAFEHVMLIPYPKDSVEISIELRNNRREVVASLTHTVSPDDILIQPKGYGCVTPYTIVQQAADTLHCVRIAFVAEGYQEKEMPIFMGDVAVAVDALFQHEPFKRNREDFQIIAVQSPSADSGVSEPKHGSWKATAVGSHFDTFYMDRYLTTQRMKVLHDLLAGTPYDHIIVLANTSNYGGGGILNHYNLSMTHHPKFRQVVVHEFGHSFAGLADEYAYESEQIPMYPPDVEPWEPNITTLVSFEDKWSGFMEKADGIGLYEGAGYNLKGIYRAFPDCRMRTNEHPEFCLVCQQAIQEVIGFYTGKQ